MLDTTQSLYRSPPLHGSQCNPRFHTVAWRSIGRHLPFDPGGAATTVATEPLVIRRESGQAADRPVRHADQGMRFAALRARDQRGLAFAIPSRVASRSKVDHSSHIVCRPCEYRFKSTPGGEWSHCQGALSAADRWELSRASCFYGGAVGIAPRGRLLRRSRAPTRR